MIRWPEEGLLQNCGPECKVWARRKTEGRGGNLSQDAGESGWFVFSNWWGFFGGNFRAVSPSPDKGMWKSGKSSKVFKGTCLRKVAGGVGGGFGLLFIELG